MAAFSVVCLTLLGAVRGRPSPVLTRERPAICSRRRSLCGRLRGGSFVLRGLLVPSRLRLLLPIFVRGLAVLLSDFPVLKAVRTAGRRGIRGDVLVLFAEVGSDRGLILPSLPSYIPVGILGFQTRQ